MQTNPVGIFFGLPQQLSLSAQELNPATIVDKLGALKRAP
jgi:hypothetical protein